MAETTTIARPYAQAVFELANSQKRLKEWSEMLAFAAAVVSDAQMRAFIDNPRVHKHDLEAAVLGVCGNRLDTFGANLIKVLVANDRLAVLPEIASLYEDLRAEAERTVKAELITAFEVDKAHQAKIAAALKQRLGKEVALTCQVDESLLGGAIVRAGDLVIDGSVAGQLNKLAFGLAH